MLRRGFLPYALGVDSLRPAAYAFGFLSTYAAFIAFREQRREVETLRDKYEKQLSEQHAKLDQKRERLLHKELLGNALADMTSLLITASKIELTTSKEVIAESEKLKTGLMQILKSLEPMGSGEMNLIGLAPKRRMEGSVGVTIMGGNGENLTKAEHFKRRLIAEIQGKIDVVRGRLERM